MIGCDFPSRSRAARDRRIALTVLVALLAVMLWLPGGARAATLAQVRAQLLGWHLRPGPLFPTTLPAGYAGTDVTLERWSGMDFSVNFERPNCWGRNPLCVDYRRFSWGALDSILHGSSTQYVQPMTIGTRSGYAVDAGHSNRPYVFAWHEQGRTYMAQGGSASLAQAIRDLTPLVESLQALPTPPPDPCAQRWPAGGSVRHKGGRLIYDRQASLRMVCHGFGTDTGGLHVHWLTWGMKCSLVATAIGARYGHDAEFLAGGACSGTEVAQHPGVVSAIGAACSTASALLGLPFKVLGTISGMACEAAPSVGTGFGTKLEAHHEFQVAQDVMRKHRCIEYRMYLGVSSWHAVRCPEK